MKTHKEIHDTIQQFPIPDDAGIVVAAGFNELLDILHALNDRVGDVEKRLAKLEKVVTDLCDIHP